MLRVPGLMGRYNQNGYLKSFISWYNSNEYKAKTQEGNLISPVLINDYIKQLYAYNSSFGLIDVLFGKNHTFARASQGGYFSAAQLYTLAGVDVARFNHRAATGQPRGLLMEPQRTNSIRYSGDVGNSAWIKWRCSVGTTNSVKAPDGVSDVFPVVIDDTFQEHWPNMRGTITADAVFTVSVYLKAGTWERIRFSADSDGNVNGFNVGVDLTSGTIISTNAYGSGVYLSSSITPAPNGWYRVTMTGKVDPAALDPRYGVKFLSTTGSIQIQGNGTDSFYMWGMQVEIGSAATSHIPTTSAATTRATDLCPLQNISGLNLTNGTIIVEFETPSVVEQTSGFNPRILQVGDASNNFALVLDNNQPRVSLGAVNSGSGVLNINTSNGSVPASAVAKAAIRFSNNNWAICANGGAVVTNTLVAMPTVASAVRLSSRTDTSGIFNGHIRSVKWYNGLLTDAELQRFTA